MKNTIEQNTFEVPPEKQFPVISPELREKAKVIAEFRAELRQNLLVEPRKEPSSFTIRTK